MYSFRELLQIKKKDVSSFKKNSIAILSDQTTQFLKKTIYGYGLKKLFNLSIWEAPINQIDNEILNPESSYNNKNFDTTIIFESTHSLLKKYNSNSSSEDFSQKQFDRIKKLVERIQKSNKSKVILFNFYELNDQLYGNFSSKSRTSFIYHLRKLNFLISEFSLNENRICILDISTLQNRIGSKNMVDLSMYVNYGMIFHLDTLPHISKNIIDILLSQNSIFKKCLILDLDDTLWGGIIGDDGIENIQLGNLGVGKAFVDFQYWVKKLKQRGIIICICSKNNESEAKNVFINHPDMVLSLDDISVFVANWNSKVDNIKNIQKVLNIGFDSIVFIDDNPYERNLVRDNIPDITVPEMPEDPSNYLQFLYDENLFETNNISNLDKDRTKLYQTEYEREKSKSKFTDLSDYMINLEMESKIDYLTEFNIPRVSQLSQRSNQFNLRTVRYSEEDLFEIMRSDNKYGLVFHLKDKFGDYGIISYVILTMMSSNKVFIENWAMSCRVFGRGMENFILNNVEDFCVRKKINQINSEYKRTSKNTIVKDLYSKLGFKKNRDKYSLKTSMKKRLETKIKIYDEKNRNIKNFK